MPKRTDIKSIMIIGAGPIVIGQACEFDYSGAQACKALKEEGYRVILVNSNPATIMTDPEMADATYIEPITPAVVARIIEVEKPDALLPTMGGQTALNTALALFKDGTLERLGVEMIGAKPEAIEKAEDRELFKEAMERIGLAMPKARFAHSMEECFAAVEEIGFPAIIRPSFTMGGSGGGIAYNLEEFETICRGGLTASPTKELLVEESILGWKEFEMEVVRDTKDNCIIICSIENFDPMGVHTGDSITVAPAQTLTDREYQIMRNASIAVLREIGGETGGSNVQFAINPDDGRMTIIEMNPRVSRSSALASKATGFPIAKVAAKLAVGYTLDELTNEITGATPVSFEPSIDYVVTKVPRFTFEKFAAAEPILGTQMKSVGEAMAIGRTFAESLQKAIRSLETGKDGFDEVNLSSGDPTVDPAEKLRTLLVKPGPERLWAIGQAFREGWSLDEIFQATKIDPWFLDHIEQILNVESELATQTPSALSCEQWREIKSMGFSDRRIAKLMGTKEDVVRATRLKCDVRPAFKRVDTCAGEFRSETPYLYSSYETDCEAGPSDRRKIMILGGGPNRIGQGIEFDYCCCHAAFSLSKAGFETIMVNCNPETVSTDYDTSDRLYFEPLTFEDVMAIVEVERPEGVIVQFGGQTPLKLANALQAAGVPIIGTSPDSIDLAEDRERFQKLVHRLGLLQPENGVARSEEEAMREAAKIGYPVVVRPSYVLGGRAMEIVEDDTGLARYMREAVQVSPDHPVLLDRYLRGAIEVDVDAVCDGSITVIGGVMEHIEEAGVHSGDSACCLPPHSLPADVLAEIRSQTVLLAEALKVVGLMNIQFAVQEGTVYLLEVNPRASRTVPFVGKATGIPVAGIAARVMAGEKLTNIGYTQEVIPPYFCVKEAVFPFLKFPGVDPILGPEMRSTGEVMGIDADFPLAFYKAQLAAGSDLPTAGTVFISLREEDKGQAVALGRGMADLGFTVLATRGTAALLAEAGVPVEAVNKVGEGRPDIVDRIKSNDVHLVFNTTAGRRARADSSSIRRGALQAGIPYFTTVAGAMAAVEAIARIGKGAFNVASLQECHRR